MEPSVGKLLQKKAGRLEGMHVLECISGRKAVGITTGSTPRIVRSRRPAPGFVFFGVGALEFPPCCPTYAHLQHVERSLWPS